MSDHTPREMMAITAGRLIKDGDIVFAGTGISLLAATVAKKIHAPKSVIFFESGGIDPPLRELPLTVADSRVMSGTCLNSGLIEAFSILGHRRLHTIALLGAAQIDRFGNLNSTCIGDHRKPAVRFSGSGGACDAGCLASEVIVFMQHERRRFLKQVDYLTSPGWLEGGDSRKKAGLIRGGPVAVVTNLGLMRFEENTKAMYLAEHYPGTTVDEVIRHTGFEIDVSRASPSMAPSEDEIRTLRETVDPQRLILGQ